MSMPDLYCRYTRLRLERPHRRCRDHYGQWPQEFDGSCLASRLARVGPTSTGVRNI